MKSLALNTAAANIVTLHKNKPFTTSLVIADGVGLEHRVVIRLVRKYQKDFEEFGILNFESSKKRGTRGLKTEYAVLTEDQATFLMMLFKPSPIVAKFRIQLVKAFRKAITELDYLRNQKSEPSWKYIRDETKLGFKWMADNLKEQRLAIGKETKNVHYMVEAKLINGVINGVFAGMDRNMLPSKDLAMIADLQRYNARLIAQDVHYADRKTMLVSYLAPKLQELREVVA